jgi:1-acyl-sn-glycerol-3-phosphate acyltransferase
VLTHRVWRGAEHVPREGGVVLCCNHISFADPLVLAHFVHDSGRTIRFLAKASLFRLPVVCALIRGAGQIPVERSGPLASRAFQRAVQAVRRGECIAIYPEGTLGKDPSGWPMVGRTGAARVALATGAPVIPVAQWGAQELLPPYSARLSLWPRKTVHVVAGAPVDLAEYENCEPTPELLRATTERIMSAITELLSEIREESSPGIRPDIREPGVLTPDS